MFVDGAWSPYNESPMGYRNEKYVDYVDGVKKYEKEYKEKRKKDMCPYCHGMGGKHDYRCPYYKPPKARYYCDICGEGIYEDQKYIENESGKCAHVRCVRETMTASELLNWLGTDIQTYREGWD